MDLIDKVAFNICYFLQSIVGIVITLLWNR